nr:basic salivary proline-rich protein 4-like [Manis javanica]
MPPPRPQTPGGGRGPRAASRRQLFTRALLPPRLTESLPPGGLQPRSGPVSPGRRPAGRPGGLPARFLKPLADRGGRPPDAGAEAATSRAARATANFRGSKLCSAAAGRGLGGGAEVHPASARPAPEAQTGGYPEPGLVQGRLRARGPRQLWESEAHRAPWAAGEESEWIPHVELQIPTRPLPRARAQRGRCARLGAEPQSRTSEESARLGSFSASSCKEGCPRRGKAVGLPKPWGGSPSRASPAKPRRAGSLEASAGRRGVAAQALSSPGGPSEQTCRPARRSHASPNSTGPPLPGLDLGPSPQRDQTREPKPGRPPARSQSLPRVALGEAAGRSSKCLAGRERTRSVRALRAPPPPPPPGLREPMPHPVPSHSQTCQGRGPAGLTLLGAWLLRALEPGSVVLFRSPPA